MRYTANAKGRVILALAAFGIAGAVGCESLTAPELDSQSQVVASDQSREEDETLTGFDGFSGGGAEVDEQGRHPARTDKYFEE